MMKGYLNQPQKTAETFWIDKDGNRWVRTGDVGRFDAEGFLTLMDRKKDMIISGGFNIYPSDIEAIASQHPDVLEVAVVGMPSEDWGETPVAFAVARPGTTLDPAELKAWTNAKVGKTQRLSDVVDLRGAAAQRNRQGAETRTTRPAAGGEGGVVGNTHVSNEPVSNEPVIPGRARSARTRNPELLCVERRVT